MSLVIPAHNEEVALPHVLRRIPDAIDEVVLVDNASTDGTAAVAARLGARVVSCPRKGYGFAYRTGLPAARGDLIVTADADATYPLEDAPRLLDLVIDRRIDFLSCSRFPLVRAAAMPWTIRWGNAAMTMLANALFGCRMRDLLTGMWVLRRDILDDLVLLSGNWNLSEEIKLEVWANPTLRFEETCIEYRPRVGVTKVSHFLVVWENARFLFEKLRHCRARFPGETWGRQGPPPS